MSSNPALNDYMANQVFVAFDTETTGLWAATNRIVEIGAVAFRLSGGEISSFESLANPGRPIPEEVIEIHGITDAIVHDADPIGKVLVEFIKFCPADSILIAHNAPFDISFVGWELKRNEMTFGDNPILDSKTILQRLCPGLKSYSLENLARHFDLLDGSQSHRALGDARLVHGVIDANKEKLGSISSREELLAKFSPHSMSDWMNSTDEIPDEFAPILKAIESGNKIRIEYSRGGEPPQSRRVKPLLMHRLGQNVYLNAYCLEVEAERTFRTDRIISYELIDG